MRKNLFFTLMVVLFFGTMTAQTTYHVSAYNGSDTADGLSWNTAFRTVDAALDRASIMGANTYLIKVAQGRYDLTDNETQVDAQGNNGEPDEYRFFGNGYDITIQGGYSTPDASGNVTYNEDVYKAVLSPVGDDISDSAFRIMNDSDAKLRFENIIIPKADQGDNFNASFLTFQQSLNAGVFFDNVNIEEWKGGSGEGGRGYIFVFNSTNTIIEINHTLVQRTLNRSGAGQFVMVNDQSENVDITVYNSVFRNLRGIGLNAALFYLNLGCDDQGQSSMIVKNSEFYNNKRGLAFTQSASVIKAVRLPLLRLEDNIFQGNAGGDGGVIHFKYSGELYSTRNLYQDNFAGQGGGVFYIENDYNCSASNVENKVSFVDDEFYNNTTGGSDSGGGFSGRGGAIVVGKDITGGAGGPINKTILIQDSKFYGNSTQTWDGGAIKANTSTSFDIINSIFCNNETNTSNLVGNQSNHGGAISAIGSGRLTISGSTFRNNASKANGGAVYVSKDELYVDSCSNFDGNTAKDQGGAINAYTTKIVNIDGSLFNNNRSINGFGGALRVDSNADLTTVTNSSFTNNTANETGGAIRTNTKLNMDNVTFEGNETETGSGGAVYIAGTERSELNNINFVNNESGQNGGAISIYNDNPASQNAFLQVLNSYFINNSANDDGGAIELTQYGSEINNNFFKDNEAGKDGGAIEAYGTSRHDHIFTQNKFYDNKATQDGGAIRFEGTARSEVDVTYNEFHSNNANNRGGAIAVFAIGVTVGQELDNVTYNKFHNNMVANNPNNLDPLRKSDIFLEKSTVISSDYYAGIGNLDFNTLQFTANTTIYPTDGQNDGFNLGTNNNPPASFTQVDEAFSNTLPECTIIDCPVPYLVPPSPLILSANGRDTNVQDDYTSYTQVNVDRSCASTATEVAFSARSNQAPFTTTGRILPDPIPHLVFTYDIIETNNVTGVTTTIVNQTMDYATATDPSTNNRHEKISEEVPGQEGEGSNERARDIYHVYFLDVTDYIKPGHTYAYKITAIQIANTSDLTDTTVNPKFYYVSDPVNVDDAVYQTVIETEFCDSDGDGIPNHIESPTGEDPAGEDADGDGVPDYMDPDATDFVDDNNDGIDDNYDTDGDGQPDFLDIDSDNDGILDEVEAIGPDNPNPLVPADTDGDGVPDYLDLDSDNDSINDVDEGNPDAQDLDGDGMVDGPYGDNGLADSLEDPNDPNFDTFDSTVSLPVNTDCADPNDPDNPCDEPDYRDIDSDNDGTNDIVDETPYGDSSTPPQSQDPTADTDGDGIVDDTTDYDGDGIMDAVDKNPTEFGESVYCEINPSAGTAGRTTNVGISTLNRNTEVWLPKDNKIGAYLILESKEKGFVVPRISTNDIINNIGINTDNGVEAGMVVWDTTEGCLKMFYDDDNDSTTPMTWSCISSDSCKNIKP